jgi:hypothetical protein
VGGLESDRAPALATELATAGADARDLDDELAVEPRGGQAGAGAGTALPASAARRGSRMVSSALSR